MPSVEVKLQFDFPEDWSDGEALEHAGNMIHSMVTHVLDMRLFCGPKPDDNPAMIKAIEDRFQSDLDLAKRATNSAEYTLKTSSQASGELK